MAEASGTRDPPMPARLFGRGSSTTVRSGAQVRRLDRLEELGE